jgi:hypothetical protein
VLVRLDHVADDIVNANYGKPIAMEVKMPGEKLRPDQERMKAVMTNPWNGWQWFTVYSLEEVREVLR